MDTSTLSAHNLYCIGKHVMGDKKGFLDNLIKDHENADRLNSVLQAKPHLQYVVAGLMVLDQKKREEQAEPSKSKDYSFAAQLALILGLISDANAKAPKVQELQKFLKLDEIEESELQEERVAEWINAYKTLHTLPETLDLSSSDGGITDYTYNLITFVLDPQDQAEEVLEEQHSISMDLNQNDED